MPSYTTWWLSTHRTVGGRRPDRLRPRAAADLAGLYDPAPDDLPAVAGVLGGLDDVLADPDRALGLLDRLGDPGRTVPGPTLRDAYPRLALVLSDQVEPPDRVRGPERPCPALGRWCWTSVPAAAARSRRPVPAGAAAGPVADLLDLPLACELVAAAGPESTPVRRLAWADVPGAGLAAERCGGGRPRRRRSPSTTGWWSPASRCTGGRWATPTTWSGPPTRPAGRWPGGSARGRPGPPRSRPLRPGRRRPPHGGRGLLSPGCRPRAPILALPGRATGPASRRPGLKIGERRGPRYRAPRYRAQRYRVPRRCPRGTARSARARPATQVPNLSPRPARNGSSARNAHHPQHLDRVRPGRWCAPPAHGRGRARRPPGPAGQRQLPRGADWPARTRTPGYRPWRRRPAPRAALWTGTSASPRAARPCGARSAAWPGDLHDDGVHRRAQPADPRHAPDADGRVLGIAAGRRRHRAGRRGDDHPMGVVGRMPIALATGLGLNAFVAVAVATRMSWAGRDGPGRAGGPDHHRAGADRLPGGGLPGHPGAS